MKKSHKSKKSKKPGVLSVLHPLVEAGLSAAVVMPLFPLIGPNIAGPNITVPILGEVLPSTAFSLAIGAAALIGAVAEKFLDRLTQNMMLPLHTIVAGVLALAISMFAFGSAQLGSTLNKAYIIVLGGAASLIARTVFALANDIIGNDLGGLLGSSEENDANIF